VSAKFEKSVQRCSFCPSSCSQPPQPLGNHRFLPQLLTCYNFAACGNLVRVADHTVEVDSHRAALNLVQNFEFPPSSCSQPPPPLGNPRFLPQLLARYNFVPRSNLVRGACRMLFAPGGCFQCCFTYSRSRNSYSIFGGVVWISVSRPKFTKPLTLNFPSHKLSWNDVFCEHANSQKGP